MTGAQSACAVTWCTWGNDRPCAGEHFADPGNGPWPSVTATADLDREPSQLAAAPTWVEEPGWLPAVVLYSPDRDQVWDLTPAQARTLAYNLLRAAVAAEDTPIGLVP